MSAKLGLFFSVYSIKYVRELQHKRLGLPEKVQAFLRGQHPSSCARMPPALHTLKPQAATVSAPDCCTGHPFPSAHAGLTVSCSLFWGSFSASHPLSPEDP